VGDRAKKKIESFFFFCSETRRGVSQPNLMMKIALLVCGLLLRVAISDSLKVEAVLDEYSKGGGKDGSDQIKTHYSNETLANMPRIMMARVHDLVTLYCPQLIRDLALFALEHGPNFGVNNDTLPNFDHYDVGQRVLMMLESVDGFPVLSEAASQCRESVSKQHSSTPKRQHALWIVACMAEEQEKERDTRTGDEVFLRWTAHLNANVAMDALGHILRCPQLMTRLAAHQIDVEYRRDALRKAADTGKLSAERLTAALAQVPLPKRADYQRTLMAQRNNTLASIPFNTTTTKGILADVQPIKTSPCAK
jgi:hypothetical protein